MPPDSPTQEGDCHVDVQSRESLGSSVCPHILITGTGDTTSDSPSSGEWAQVHYGICLLQQGVLSRTEFSGPTTG